MQTQKLVNNALFGKTELANVKVELASIDSIYQSLFDSNKIAINSQIKQSISELGKSASGYTSAKSEINDIISKINALGPSLMDSKQGNWLKTSLQICDDNIKKLQQAQGALNQADKTVNSLQSKGKL